MLTKSDSRLRANNARANLCLRKFSKFLKCLKWPQTYSNLIKKWFWAFFIFARALTRGRTRTRAFFYLKLTGRILTLIVINMNDKWFTVMKIWSWVDFTRVLHKMAPGWRHDILMNLKMFLSRLMTMTYDCVKFERNWRFNFE